MRVGIHLTHARYVLVIEQHVASEMNRIRSQ
jgi:hypothetical protein